MDKWNVSIENPYLSVKVAGDVLGRLQESLLPALHPYTENNANGIEKISNAHVSIAYIEGQNKLFEMVEVMEFIARQEFEVRATGFDLLQGKNTDFDYIGMTIEFRGSMSRAVGAVKKAFKIKEFKGGFKGHVSLFRYAKGSLSSDAVETIIRELNASTGVAFFVGGAWIFRGEAIEVFNCKRVSCYQVPLSCTQKSKFEKTSIRVA